MGPAGVLALADHVTRPLLEGMLTDAKEFVAEWLEMRPVFQHRLFGQCMRAPLQVHLYKPLHSRKSVVFLAVTVADSTTF